VSVNTYIIRDECQERLVELISAPDGVEVLDNEPRDWMQDGIFVADTVGTISYPVQAYGLIPRDDEFSIVVVCVARHPADTAREAKARVQSYAQAVMEAVSVGTGPTLGDLPGAFDATISNVDGPDALPAAEGYAAVMTVTVDVHTRITL